MRRIEPDSAIRRVRDVCLALAGLLVLSMTANLALSMSFAGRETVTVLVPASAGPSWAVAGAGAGTGLAGTRYLEDVTRTAAMTLLTLTPENANHVRLAAARMSHASARGAIGAWVESKAARLAGRDMASASYPTEIEADPERLSVEIVGELVTWFGREDSSRPTRLPLWCRSDRVGALRTGGAWNMTHILRRHAPAALAAARRLTMGALAPPAAAMQILDAADHAELAAEISATSVNCIALTGDRVATVARAPDGFAVEHDARSGDLHLRPSAPAASEDAARGPVALFIGSEKGFAYRRTPTLSGRGSTRIPIRNAKASRRRVAPDSGRHDSRSSVWGIGGKFKSERFPPAFPVSG